MPKQPLPSYIGPYQYFTQGTQVCWDNKNWQTGQVSSGTIVGLASQPLVVIGPSYIIAANGTFDPQTYPYSHFVLPEVALAEIPEED